MIVLPLAAQQGSTNETVNAIVKEATNNSQLKRMAHELMDEIGPRLVGSTKMVQASDWAFPFRATGT